MPSSVQIQRITTTTATVNHHNHHHKQQPSTATTTTIWNLPSSITVPEDLIHHHTHAVGPHQCSSAVVQSISAEVSTVWSVVRRFDNPQAYKHFLKSCDVILGNGDVGTLREVHVVSGLPAGSSTERLEILDDVRHVISFSVVGGDHRLNNYRSVTTLHPSPSCDGSTVVVESYVVDVPPENTKEERLSRFYLDYIFGNLVIKLRSSKAKSGYNLFRTSGIEPWADGIFHHISRVSTLWPQLDIDSSHLIFISAYHRFDPPPTTATLDLADRATADAATATAATALDPPPTAADRVDPRRPLDPPPPR
ncbi:hypothetical protein OSB04_026305 [Centaurea solstitialis]|uniref:Uncharacterized protein n=1 Tax=Centaurea solstitialis TaxID=347529 RepID=A0AA38SCX0_9ASTR|nr:hypothetical protein OSB04_026305 [Centaurea solstitialis]